MASGLWVGGAFVEHDAIAPALQMHAAVFSGIVALNITSQSCQQARHGEQLGVVETVRSDTPHHHC